MGVIKVHALQVALVLLSAFGGYATWGLADKNGTFNIMREMRDNGPHYLPGTKEPLRKFYTGVEQIDYRLQVLATFFWPAVTGEHPAILLQSLHFAGQFAAAYIIVLIEGMRKGNKGRAVSYVIVWGMLYQNVAYAITMPLSLLAHLATSATIVGTKDILPCAAEVASIPISIIVGYMVPGFLMSLPFPAKVTSDEKQIYMALWQVFPIWVAIIQQVSKRVFGALSANLSKSSKTTSVWALRSVYAFAFGSAAMTHIASVGIAGMHDLMPRLFNKNIEKHMGLSRTFVPMAYLPSQSVPNITEGSFLLLQWDEIVGSAAILLWAVLMLVRSWPSKASRAASLGIVSTVVLSTLISGPVGCATLLMWIRDEIVLDYTVESGKKLN